MSATVYEIFDQIQQLDDEDRGLLDRLLEKYKPKRKATPSEALQTMLATEAVLCRDWDSPEEDEAWADL